ncbi:cobyrinate a,c-diamide synthase [Yoonia sediminilitoris]|uniref:Hydrogenobyrinate a,c-diamide synthase n=1 Tax=Yoonia sediminilitoris TaxID=1286148 RepID=A0A2T6KRZ8_9RHOB|nr:cobyrinate a,c-diamide synthase [Yoonia sediminilitoris]PUB19333.1 cobyrinic acid a,c-diamide synthase [Yoonia sediminilitoris]RCW99501.1 cobyrinic acid a,c-diamide synthase [Yoonia sediminilitoris]
MSFIIAAPASGSGKTTITLGLLRAVSRTQAVRAAKSGPDYIDPRFHEAACGQPCYNLDAWAMSVARIRALAAGSTPLIIEGAMGLFDGAPPDGKGATADLARILGLPVILVVDASAMAQSIAPLVAGFAAFDPAVRIAGVILNRTGSDRHIEMLKRALAPNGIPVLGAVPRQTALARPSRHLGLVQAGEMTDLEPFLDHAADVMSNHIDIARLLTLGGTVPSAAPPITTPPKYARIAVARDAAFAFTYAHDVAKWTDAGTEIRWFSPLADDPVPEADQIFLPGGYPELHAAQLAQAQTFLNSLRNAAQTTAIYGECGGYMILGETLTDADGIRHKMAGLLGLDTSFSSRKLHLGYRKLRYAQSDKGDVLNGHEFHYATTVRAEGMPLFKAQDAQGNRLPPMGLVEGRVSGSFAHVIDVA